MVLHGCDSLGGLTWGLGYEKAQLLVQHKMEQQAGALVGATVTGAAAG